MIVLHFWTNTLVIWPGQVLGVGMIAAMIWLFWRAQRSPTNPFDFGTMFVWPSTGQTSLILFLAFVAGMGGTWVILDREFRSVLTTEMFLGFLGIMIFGKGATEAINMLGNRPPAAPPPAPAPNQIIGSAAQVNAAPPVLAAADPQPQAAESATDVQPAARPRKRAKVKRKAKR